MGFISSIVSEVGSILVYSSLAVWFSLSAVPAHVVLGFACFPVFNKEFPSDAQLSKAE